MWYATGALLVLLGAYVWLLVSLKARGERAELGSGPAAAAPERSRPARERYATDAGARTARPAFNGLAAFGGDDLASIVVRPAGREVGVARA
jgi:hypothetical protein